MKTKGKYILATILVLFGLLTLFLTSSIFFDCCGIREKEGNYVLSIVWVNFIASLLYLASAYGILQRKNWYVKLLFLAVGVLVIGQIFFFAHVINGGLYETKTVGAMIFRIAFTVLLAFLAYSMKSNESKATK